MCLVVSVVVFVRAVCDYSSVWCSSGLYVCVCLYVFSCLLFMWMTLMISSDAQTDAQTLTWSLRKKCKYLLSSQVDVYTDVLRL